MITKHIFYTFFLFVGLYSFTLSGSNSLFDKKTFTDAPTTLKLATKKLTKKEKDPYRKQLRAHTKKVIRFMTETELKEAARLNIVLSDFDEALLYLRQLVKITQSITTAKNAKLEIADITFQMGNLKKAAEYYEEYISLYPGDKEKVAYASYKGLLSHFYSMLPADRDQTSTLKTINLAHSFLSNKSSLFFKTYLKDVENIKTVCFSRLWEHDVVVFEFHMKRGTVKAANVCLADAREKLLPQLPGLEPKILQCEYKVALAQNDTQRATRISHDLATRFPETVRVASVKKPTNFATRF